MPVVEFITHLYVHGELTLQLLKFSYDCDNLDVRIDP